MFSVCFRSSLCGLGSGHGDQGAHELPQGQRAEVRQGGTHRISARKTKTDTTSSTYSSKSERIRNLDGRTNRYRRAVQEALYNPESFRLYSENGFFKDAVLRGASSVFTCVHSSGNVYVHDSVCRGKLLQNMMETHSEAAYARPVVLSP